jgi:NAD(P)-dependent dehydrogenase (short-subunit alcohol dehydrogenase family)
MADSAFDLTSRVAVVTGASSGMGEAIAREMALSGARVVLVGRNEERLARVTDEIREAGGECHAVRLDVNDEDAPGRIVSEALETYGALNILAPVAGIFEWGPFESITVESFDRQWATNVRAPYRLIQAAMPHLKPDGAILLVSSIAGLVGFPESVAYSATKGAIALMTKALAMEFAGQGVRVNALAPGEIDTPMNVELYKNPDYVPYAISQTPARRLGYPDDVAPAAVFLCSPAAKFIHGVILAVDGGWTAI